MFSDGSLVSIGVVLDTRGWRLFTFCAGGDAGVYLFSMHGNRFWRLDTKANLVAIDGDHKNLHLVPNSDGLTRSSRQNEHVISVFSPTVPCLISPIRSLSRGF